MFKIKNNNGKFIKVDGRIREFKTIEDAGVWAKMNDIPYMKEKGMYITDSLEREMFDLNTSKNIGSAW